MTRSEQKAQTTIGQNVDDLQIHHIRDCKSAKEIWDTLQGVYEKDTPSNRIYIVRQIMSQKVSEGADIEKHVTKMTELFQRLFSLGDMDPEFFKSAALLSSLPESYDGLVTALEARSDGQLNAKVVTEKIISEYRRRKEKDGESETALKASNYRNKSTDKACFFCKKPGHFRNKCVKYKEWQSRQNSNNADVKQNANIVAKAGSDEYLFVTSSMNDGWLIDSGATCHIANSRNGFLEFSEDNHDKIHVLNDQVLMSKGIGTICMDVLNAENEISSVRVTNVLYVPEAGGNLLSVSRLTAQGFKVSFDKNSCLIMNKSGTKQIAIGDQTGNLYKLRKTESANLVQEHKTSGCVHFWHRVLGHRDINVVKGLAKGGLVEGIDIAECDDKCNDDQCAICLEGKLTRMKFPQQSQNKSKAVLDLVHSDVCGPMQTLSASGKRYILTFIDDKSRYTTIFLLKEKSEVLNKFKEFLAFGKTKFGRTIKCLRSDRGGEYLSNEFLEYLAREGIANQRTAPSTPEQNGCAERKNRTLIEMARCMLLEAQYEKKFWGEAVNMANYVQNRLPTRGIDKTPYEIWNGFKPSIKHFMMFGAKCFVHVPTEKRRKLDATGMAGSLMGYDDSSKAYRIYMPSTGKVVVSRDVRFVRKNDTWPNTCVNEIISDDSHVVSRHPANMEAAVEGEDLNVINGDQEHDQTLTNEDDNNELSILTNDFSDDEEFFTDEAEDTIIEPEVPIRRSERVNKGVPPKRLIEEINVAVSSEPKTYNQAVTCDDRENWISAMKEEIESLHENGTWELVDLPENKKPIGCKWVYKIKTNENGSVTRYRARLVAQGFSQKFGSDYDQVFAPVAKLTTLRIMLSLANKNGWHVVHVDAKTAFLNGKLEETIFMRQPPGFISEGNEERVCCLKRSLYGLKQAARSWNQTLHEYLIASGFRQSMEDPCLYIKEENGVKTYIVVYVDDMSIFSKSKQAIEKAEQILSKKFKIQNLGAIKCYLGLEVTRDKGGNYMVNQSKYINQVVEQFGLKDAKESKFPLSVGYGKQNSENVFLTDNSDYRKLVGCLLYIAINTRLDIAASVSILAQKVCQPTQNDWVELKRVLKYLKGTINFNLRLSATKFDDLLYAYTDANWAEDRLDRKSNTGYVIFVCGGAVSWCSKKQTCVALSSTEAEFIALSEGSMEVIWIRRLLEELGENLEQPTVVYEDNQSCLKLIENEKFSNRSKHIDTRKFFVKSHVNEKTVQCVYCPTEQMLADMMTKPLPASRIQRLSRECGLFN